MQETKQQAQSILAQYGLSDASLSQISIGHINETYRVDFLDKVYILQRLNPIFAPEVHFDMVEIGRHLKKAHLDCPDLVLTQKGALWATDTQNRIWRLQTFVPGYIFVAIENKKMCHAAGFLLGQFHMALTDVHYIFRNVRLGIHDLDKHLQGLISALENHKNHVAYPEVLPWAQTLLENAQALPAVQDIPTRIVHGDPKISNFVFSDPKGHHGRALIDLDTLGHMPLPLELGDALRSWCNPNGEGQGQSFVDLHFFEAGLQGYADAAGTLLTPQECALLPRCVEIISTELTARFLRDVLEERYFGWDRQNYSAAWQHNLVRAKSQWDLAQDCVRQKPAMEKIVQRLF